MFRKLLVSVMAGGAWMSVLGGQPERGYRGFVEWNNDVHADVSIYGGPTDSRFYTGVSTTHGYQLKPWLFVGGGVALEMWPKYHQAYSLPVYAAGRIDLGHRRVTPFVDVRLGYNTLRGGGVYFSPTIGLRCAVYKSLAVNFSVGYTMNGRHQNYVYMAYDDPSNNGWAWVTENDGYRYGHERDGLIALRLGVEF